MNAKKNDVFPIFAAAIKSLPIAQRELLKKKLTEETLRLLHSQVQDWMQKEYNELKNDSPSFEFELPAHCKFISKQKGVYYLVVEEPPRCRTISYWNDVTCRNEDYYLSFPYVQYYIALHKVGNVWHSLTGLMPMMSLSQEPVTSKTQLCRAPLPNFNGAISHCIALNEKMPQDSPAALAQSLIRNIWLSRYSYWGRNRNPNLTLGQWHEETQKDPMFALTFRGFHCLMNFDKLMQEMQNTVSAYTGTIACLHQSELTKKIKSQMEQLFS